MPSPSRWVLHCITPLPFYASTMAGLDLLNSALKLTLGFINHINQWITLHGWGSPLSTNIRTRYSVLRITEEGMGRILQIYRYDRLALAYILRSALEIHCFLLTLWPYQCQMKEVLIALSDPARLTRRLQSSWSSHQSLFPWNRSKYVAGQRFWESQLGSSRYQLPHVLSPAWVMT